MEIARFWKRTEDAPPAIESVHAPYFVQTMRVGTECEGRSRLDVLARLCGGRRVLHVGCVDWPITDPAENLHVQLDGACARLDGFDVHPEGFERLRPLVRGAFYSDWADVTGTYDVVLAPEVLEHVEDVGGFLRRLHAIDTTHYVLTVPDAYQCARRGHFEFRPASGTFVEVVHPDHNAWYTPYTLRNVVAKYTPWSIERIWFFNGISLLALATKDPSYGGPRPTVA